MQTNRSDAEQIFDLPILFGYFLIDHFMSLVYSKVIYVDLKWGSERFDDIYPLNNE